MSLPFNVHGIYRGFNRYILEGGLQHYRYIKDYHSSVTSLK